MPRCVIQRSACPPTSAAPLPTSPRSTRATGALRLGKTLTTPQRLVTGIESGVGKAGSQFSAARMFLHGTTVAINTILERSGAKCALLTTQGFRDIYEIGRVNRPESYNLFFQKHTPLIERDLRFEIMERMDSQGTVLIPLDEEQVRTVAKNAVDQGVQAIAILFLHSYRNPAHEQRAKALDRAPNFPQLFVTSSHELSQEYREYERTSTAAANAYVGPRVQRYLTEMEAHLDDAGFAGNFLIVQSTGGLFDVDDARQSCIRMLESGPAAGVVGTKALCDSHQYCQCDRLRHGRHHRQGRRDLRGQRADDRRGADRRLCHRSAGADADDRHPGGRHRRRQHRPRRGRQRIESRPGIGGRVAGAGLLRPRRHRADHHRRQPGARPARRRPLPRRRDAARSGSGEKGADRKDRDAARPRSH